LGKGVKKAEARLNRASAKFGLHYINKPANGQSRFSIGGRVWVCYNLMKCNYSGDWHLNRKCQSPSRLSSYDEMTFEEKSMTSRDTLSAKIPSPELALALNQAARLRQAYNLAVITAETLLLAFIKTPETEAYRLLRAFSQERGFAWPDFERDIERAVTDQRWIKATRDEMDTAFDFITDAGERAPLSVRMIVVLDEGLTLAQQLGQPQCGSVHALAIIAETGGRADWALKKRGITKQAIVYVLAPPAATVDYVPPPATGPTAAAQPVGYATPPRAASIPVPARYYQRQDLLLKLMSQLSMSGKRHVILVGPPGVGKRSLAMSLEELIRQGRGPVGLRTLTLMNEQALLTDPLEAVRQAVRQAQNGLLFVPDIARFFGGIRADFREEACNELQKVFFSHTVAIIGTAAPDRFNERLSKATVILEQSYTLTVPPATVEETTEILKVLRPAIEADYNLPITESSLAETARLSSRYYTARPLPAAAVHLLHQTCAMMRMGPSLGEQAPVKKADNRIDPEDVMVATSLLTGIPVTNLGADERNRYANMVEHLHKRIIGQAEAVLALSRAVKMARVGLKDPRKPIGSFLFLGPTGVGKTELAKALAEFMFGAEEALITLDMSEYMEEASVNRLIGSPPGYVGHEAGGQLTDAVKKRPYSVVLFDEVEKASVKVFDVLLQVMDEGRLTSGQGEMVNFRECVLLMTSNIGGRYLADPNLSEAAAQAEAEVQVKEHFRPEFLNRLTDIIFFHPLSPDNLRQILDLLLAKEARLMENRIKLEVSAPARQWLLNQNDHPEWGARPLQRLIQQHLREPIADFLLKDDPAPGTPVKVQVSKDNKLVFKTGKSKEKG
jgi:ATP-dependent Clp protease ATP-binding subunit ClpC